MSTYYHYKAAKYMNKCADQLLTVNKNQVNDKHRKLAHHLVMDGGSILSNTKIHSLKNMSKHRGGGDEEVREDWIVYGNLSNAGMTPQIRNEMNRVSNYIADGSTHRHNGDYYQAIESFIKARDSMILYPYKFVLRDIKEMIEETLKRRDNNSPIPPRI